MTLASRSFLLFLSLGAFTWTAGCGCGADASLALSASLPCGGEGDLNGNGRLDTDDLARGTSEDRNSNGIVDEVEIDFDGDGVLDGRVLAGRVWSDTDRDGQIDAGESGVEGVRVLAQASADGPVLETVSGPDGRWRIDGVARMPSSLVRFEDIPAPFATSFMGSDNCGAVQLVRASSTRVNLALRVPQIVDSEAARGGRFATACYVSGLAAGSTDVAFASWPTNASDLPARYGGRGLDPRPDETVDTLGAVWGQAYDPASRRIFLGAMARRHVGLAAEGLSAIHVLAVGDSGISETDVFALEGVVPANASSPISGSPIRLGSITRSGAPQYELRSDPTAPSWDVDAFDKVGRVGFGDLDMSADGSTLWAVNLNQRSLIRMRMESGTDQPVLIEQWVGPLLAGWPAAPLDGQQAASGTVMPWALKITPTRGYLGCVANADASQDPSHLRAYILAFDPERPEQGFEEVLRMRLDYAREPVITSQPNFGTPAIPGAWRPWARTWADTPYDGVANVVLAGHPQPILTDLELAPDGAFVLGFTDRFGHQGGSWNYTPVPGNTDTMLCTPGGDTLRACRMSSGTWVIEGTACAVLGDLGNYFSDDGLYDTGLEFLTDDGPSAAGEFFFMDGFYRTGYGPLHPEITTGGLAALRGFAEVTTTVYDPLSEHADAPRGGVTAQGTHAYSTVSGRLDRAYYVSYTDASITNIGKSIGLGDLEVIGPPAPVEIGNWVYLDRDRSGGQTPGDEGLEGVELVLRYLGEAILTTRTDAKGRYSFRMTQLAARRDGYTVTIDPGQAALRGLRAIAVDAVADDTRDSDAGLVVWPLSDGVNHSIDFGFEMIRQTHPCEPLPAR